MKKSLILLGMLSIGYAYAQEGNVGINTENPKATLDIVPEVGNLTKNTNEGIIAPRLTKERIAGIADANLVEGTLVYATDNTYTGANAKVSKITEKGYYFYNGTEWVKVQYKDTNDAEWVYDDATKQIKLKRSGTLFGNTVFYNKNGALQNYDFTKYNIFNINTGAITEVAEDVNNNFKNIINKKTSGINLGTATSYVMNDSRIYVDDTASSNVNILTNSIGVTVAPDNNKNYGVVRAVNGNASHYGTGNVNELVGGYFDGRLERGSSNGNVYGVRAAASYSTNKTANRLVGVGAFGGATKLSGGKINDMISFDGYKSFTNEAPLEVLNLKGFSAKNAFAATGKVSIANARGFDYEGLDLTGSTHTVANNYGLHIGDIAGGTASNYAVYTNKGQVRVGDLAQVGAGDRVVYADSNGVLKTGVAVSTDASKIASTNALQCNAENRGKMNFVQGADGKSDVFGICMKNANGSYYWGYMVGGNNPTNGTGAFGSGL